MAEREGPQINSERKIRVNRELNVAGAMVDSIGANAEAAFTAEREILRSTQPELMKFLDWRVSNGVGGNWVNDRSRDQYMRGAFTAYRIFRAQTLAEPSQNPLPQVSSEIVNTYMADDGERWQKEKQDADNTNQERSFWKIRANNLKEVDPELDRAIGSLTRFEINSDNARYGAYEVSTILNNALVAQEMEAMLSGPDDTDGGNYRDS